MFRFPLAYSTGVVPRHSARLFLLLLGWLCLQPAQAVVDLNGPLKKAQASLAKGDYETALAEFKRVAEKKHNPLAALNAGFFYQLGWGRDKDAQEACRWFDKAAAGKIPAAEFYLAECLVQGVHTAADPARAAALHRDAAERGYAQSWCALADLYMTGNGVAKDPVQALNMCQQSAQQGSVTAAEKMAGYYLHGDAAIHNAQLGYAWLERAAEADKPELAYSLAVAYRDGVEMPVNADKARFWFEKAAAAGYLAAYLPSASLYFNAAPETETGRLPPEALAKAYLWLSALTRRCAGSADSVQAQAMLDKVNTEMPASWKPELDEKVARHLGKFAGAGC